MDIRPRPFGENLSEWFRVLGRRWRPLFIVSAIVFVPIGIVIGLTSHWLDLPARSSFVFSPDELEALTYEALLEALVPLALAFIGWSALQTLGTVFVGLAASRIVTLDLGGSHPTWQESARLAGSRLMRGLATAVMVVLGAGLLIGLVVSIGWALISSFEATFATVFLTTVLALTALVIVIWLSLAFSFYLQAMAIEDSGAMTSLRRSFTLVQPRWWMTMGFVLVVSLIASAVSQVLATVILPIFLFGPTFSAAVSVGYGITAMIQGPASAAIAAGYAVWYIDLRSREAPLSSEQLL